METHANRSIHPLLVLAGIAVIVFCSVAIAAIVGWIPTTIGKSAESETAPQTRTIAPSPAEKQAETKSRSGTASTRRTAAATTAASTAASSACAECGVVESVREVNAQGKPTGAGAVGGAVVGGLVGNQMGGGRGRDVMTVVGAVGGALAGNQIEKNAKSTRSYEISVRLNDGSVRIVHESAPPAWRPGDKVKIIDGQIRSNA